MAALKYQPSIYSSRLSIEILSTTCTTTTIKSLVHLIRNKPEVDIVDFVVGSIPLRVDGHSNMQETDSHPIGRRNDKRSSFSLANMLDCIRCLHDGLALALPSPQFLVPNDKTDKNGTIENASVLLSVLCCVYSNVLVRSDTRSSTIPDRPDSRVGPS